MAVTFPPQGELPARNHSCATKRTSAIPAKQKAVKEYRSSAEEAVYLSQTTGFRSTRARFLLCSIKLELERLVGRRIPYDELGRYAGQAASTVFDKLQKADHPQIEALLGWLERLPEESRTRLVDAACRCMPTLDHPRLMHDPVQVSRLKGLLRQKCGLTLIKGGNDGISTFLITALGHTASVLEPTHGLVYGLDRFLPDWHVPVDGVAYLNSPIVAPGLREWALQVWRGVEAVKRPILMLNGVLSVLPELLRAASLLAQSQNVFIADEERHLPGRADCSKNLVVHVIHVTVNEWSQLQLAIHAG